MGARTKTNETIQANNLDGDRHRIFRDSAGLVAGEGFVNFSSFTRTRQKNEAWARQGFGTQSPDFLGWLREPLKPLGKPQESAEPPKAKSRRQWRLPLFPMEIRKGWRELPGWLRFIAVTEAYILLVLFILWACYAYAGK